MQPEITPEYLSSQGLSKDFSDRFWTKVKKTDGCWLWMAAKRTFGYGVIGKGITRDLIEAHRASWILNNGPIPNGLCVLHRCDNPPCVNPDHLWLGTRGDNNRDTVEKGRHAQELPLNAGERNANSKLTRIKIQEIRSRYSRKARNKSVLAREFGVSRPTIYKIVNYICWK